MTAEEPLTEDVRDALLRALRLIEGAGRPGADRQRLVKLDVAEVGWESLCGGLVGLGSLMLEQLAVGADLDVEDYGGLLRRVIVALD